MDTGAALIFFGFFGLPLLLAAVWYFYSRGQQERALGEGWLSAASKLGLTLSADDLSSFLSASE